MAQMTHAFDITGSADSWELRYDRYEPNDEPTREALCTLGNGFFATRGAAPEHDAGDVHYPGTYVAGVYNRLTSKVEGREVEHESLVNAPNWLPLRWRIDDGDWFSIDHVDIHEFEQTLDLRRGVLVRRVRFVDQEERETSLSERRIVHMGDPHLGFLTTSIRPENWSGEVRFRSELDGGVENRNVARYDALESRHLETLEREYIDPGIVRLRCRTNQSRVEIVQAMRTRLMLDDEEAVGDLSFSAEGDDRVGHEGSITVTEGQTLSIEKTVSLFTSRDQAISEPGLAAVSHLAETGSLEESLESHVLAWDDIWRRFELELATDRSWVPVAVKLHIFHLLQTLSPNTIDRDVGIPARGLHGEAYRGHVFWDEMFVFPLLHIRAPEITRSLLKYRYRRLGAARESARSIGHRGAMYPWQSGSDGGEETDRVHLNPRSGNWLPDKSHRQRHIGAAIAYSIWGYYQVTDDVEFMARYGAEMIIEIARFFADIATYDEIEDRYEIVGVMGPDEFQDSDPNWDGDGLRNNAYTNVMAAWVLETARSALDTLPEYQRIRLMEMLGLTHREMESWITIARKLYVPRHDGRIISQFEGYDQLLEFDWEGYRERYGDIHRLDRILESEGDSTNRYKASKQADVLMLFYLFSFEELQDLLGMLGIDFDDDMLQENVAYYLARTSHGSTLSRIVHSWVLARTDRRRSMELLSEALQSDLEDIQGGTTREGIHLGAMAGTVDLIQRGYSGFEARAGELHFKPSVPPEIEHLNFRAYYRQRWLTVGIEDDILTIESEQTDRPPITVVCREERRRLGSGESVTFARLREPASPEPVTLDDPD